MRRRAAVAGSWYPDSSSGLAVEVRRLCERVGARSPCRRVVGLISPHAGIVYSGATAATAWQAAARGVVPRVIVIVGPSHYVGFDGVSVWPRGAFECPLGDVAIDDAVARALMTHPVVVDEPRAHAREHAIEMQLPFVAMLFPRVPMVPLVMGDQSPTTVDALADALVDVLAGQDALIAASTDLSHFFDASMATTLDERTAAIVARFDDSALAHALDECPDGEAGRYVMCGGGAAVAVMAAARRLGATDASVLARTHSGDVSGDHRRVVGYLAAVFGTERSDAPLTSRHPS